MTSAKDGLPPLREVIRRHGLLARKSLGQNFLFDLNLTERIARAAGPLHGVTVYEVGPGPGGLTRALLALGAARVIAVERDHRAIAALEEIAAHYPGHLDIVAGDALTFEPRRLLDGSPARIVANLPYNIATALLVAWLSVEPWPPWFDSTVLMFQREVAERLVAAPGSKTYGRLSVLVQWRCEARILFDVNASAFVPPPKVTSSVLRLVPRAQRRRPAIAGCSRPSPRPRSASAARCCGRACGRSAPTCRPCLRPPALTRRHAPRTFVSRILSPWRAPWPSSAVVLPDSGAPRGARTRTRFR